MRTETKTAIGEYLEEAGLLNEQKINIILANIHKINRASVNSLYSRAA
ncbi:hypothetical protein NIES4101_73200 [Calothrix sp. NIES-4101]|nr:hypothetical protein NIES4101_73200 [Calothrix sp. NIES-4101]